MSNSPPVIIKKILSPEKKKQYAEARKAKRAFYRALEQAEKEEKAERKRRKLRELRTRQKKMDCGCGLTYGRHEGELLAILTCAIQKSS